MIDLGVVVIIHPALLQQVQSRVVLLAGNHVPCKADHGRLGRLIERKYLFVDDISSIIVIQVEQRLCIGKRDVLQVVHIVLLSELIGRLERCGRFLALTHIPVDVSFPPVQHRVRHLGLH